MRRQSLGPPATGPCHLAGRDVLFLAPFMRRSERVEHATNVEASKLSALESTSKDSSPSCTAAVFGASTLPAAAEVQSANTQRRYA